MRKQLSLNVGNGKDNLKIIHIVKRKWQQALLQKINQMQKNFSFNHFCDQQLALVLFQFFCCCLESCCVKTKRKQKNYRFSANHKKCLLKYTILVLEQKN
jgi:hypothetical protein